MLVAVDARNIYRSDRRGIGKVMLRLYQGLVELEPSWQFLMCYQKNMQKESLPFANSPNVRHHCFDCFGDRWALWFHVRFPWEAWRHGANVIHSVANLCPYFAHCPLVVNLHDVIPLDGANHEARRRFYRNGKRTGRMAGAIITASNFSKQEIVERLSINEKKIHVITWGRDPIYEQPVSNICPQRLEHYGIKGPFSYVLVFGAADPRKNVPRVLEAWSQLPQNARNLADLLLIGAQSSTIPFYLELAERFGLHVFVDHSLAGPKCEMKPQSSEKSFGIVRIFDYVPEEDMPALLAYAKGLCYPSLKEGFGVPVLDAFTQGAPVITSNSSSLVELANGSALLVDPQDVLSLRDSLVQLLTLPELRTKLSYLGAQRALQYDMSKTVCAYRDIFKQYEPN